MESNRVDQTQLVLTGIVENTILQIAYLHQGKDNSVMIKFLGEFVYCLSSMTQTTRLNEIWTGGMLIGGKVGGDSLRTELMKKCGRVVETGAGIHAIALMTILKKT